MCGVYFLKIEEKNIILGNYTPFLRNGQEITEKELKDVIVEPCVLPSWAK